MRARPLLAAVLLALLIGGCGGSSPQLAAMRVPEAYLPPIAPAAAPPAAAPATAVRTVRPAPKAQADESTGAPTDAEVAAELKQAYTGGRTGKGAAARDPATVGGDGLATVPITAPPKVRAMIVAGNQVARKPYVYGGGHGGGGSPEGIFTDTAYDCSGSVSYALASAGFIDSPMASGPLETFGKPGPGRWVSIYANADHAFMVVAGLRFDTVGRADHDTRWQAAGRSVAGFVVRHPPGL